MIRTAHCRPGSISVSALAVPLVTATSDAVKSMTGSLNVTVAMKPLLSVAGTPSIVAVGASLSMTKLDS